MNDSQLVDEFTFLVTAENPVHDSFMKRSLASMREDTRAELTDYLSYCLSIDLSLDYLADSYNTIVNDTFMEQMFFEENNRYRWSRFDELAHELTSTLARPKTASTASRVVCHSLIPDARARCPWRDNR